MRVFLLSFCLFLIYPIYLYAENEEYPIEMQTSVSLIDLSYSKGNFNQLLERYADIPAFSWRQFSIRSTDLPAYDIRAFGWNLVRDDVEAWVDFSIGSRLFSEFTASGVPYNVDSKIGYRRLKTGGRVEWFALSWFTLTAEQSEEDKTGWRSPTRAIGQKSEIASWQLDANFSPLFFDFSSFSNLLSETEFGNRLETALYSIQYLPEYPVSLEFSGGRGDLKSRRGGEGPSPADVDFDLMSGTISWTPVPSVELRLEAFSSDHNDRNADSLNVETRQISGSAALYFPNGLVRISLSDEARDFTGIDISDQDLESLGLMAQYRYKDYILQVFHDREDRSTSGISNIYLTNTEELARSSRVSGGSFSGFLFRDFYFLYTLRFVENNFERVSDSGVFLQKFRNQSLSLSYPVTLKASVYYTFAENAYLSRYSREFQLTQEKQNLTTQLVDSNTYHQFGVTYQLTDKWSVDFSYLNSDSDGAEEFETNSVEGREFHTRISHQATEDLSVNLDWIYSDYKDALGLSPSATAHLLGLNIRMKFS